MPYAVVRILAAYFDTKKLELGPTLTLLVTHDLQQLGEERGDSVQKVLITKK